MVASGDSKLNNCLFDKKTNTIHSAVLHNVFACVEGVAYLTISTVSLVTRRSHLCCNLLAI